MGATSHWASPLRAHAWLGGCPVQPQVAKSRTSLRVILRKCGLTLRGAVRQGWARQDGRGPRGGSHCWDGEVIEVADPGQGPVDLAGVIGGEADGAPASRRGEGSFKGPTGEKTLSARAVPGMREQRRA